MPARPSPKTRLTPKLVHKSRTIDVPDTGELNLVIVADTHSEPHPNSMDLIADAKPNAILHAGDIGDLSVIDQLEEIAQVYVIRGNIDNRASALPDTMDISLVHKQNTLLKILLMHIVLYGPTIRADAFRLAKQYAAELVICGHSHVPFLGKDKGLGVFNPGSIGPRRFSLPITFGLISLKNNALSFEHMSCETKSVWMP